MKNADFSPGKLSGRTTRGAEGGSTALARAPRLCWPRIVTALVLIVTAVVAAPTGSPQARPSVTPSSVAGRVEQASGSPRLAGRVAVSPASRRPAPAIITAARTGSATAASAPSLGLSARAVYAVDLSAQAELYAENAELPVAPASTAKIVTALVVVEHASPNAEVTIQQDDLVDPSVYSHMGLQDGDVLSVHDLLAGLLLNSAGDAALALSRYVGAALPDPATTDPRQRFVNEMNHTAVRLGMRNSHFMDPDGRDIDGQVVTARDLTLATNEMFQYQLLEKLVDMRTTTVSIDGPNARDVTLYNTNELLGTPGVHGVKTGTTDAAGQCLVLAIWRGDDRIITVVMGSSDRYADTSALLTYIDQQYRWVRLGRGGDLTALNDELAARGYSLGVAKTVLLTAADAARLTYVLNITPSNDASRLSAQGEVVFTVGTRTIWQLPIYAGDPFKPGG